MARLFCGCTVTAGPSSFKVYLLDCSTGSKYILCGTCSGSDLTCLFSSPLSSRRDSGAGLCVGKSLDRCSAQRLVGSMLFVITLIMMIVVNYDSQCRYQLLCLLLLLLPPPLQLLPRVGSVLFVVTLIMIAMIIKNYDKQYRCQLLNYYCFCCCCYNYYYDHNKLQLHILTIGTISGAIIKL